MVCKGGVMFRVSGREQNIPFVPESDQNTHSRELTKNEVKREIIGRVNSAVKIPIYLIAIVALTVETTVKLALAVVVTPIYCLTKDSKTETASLAYKWTFHAVAKNAIHLMCLADRVIYCVLSVFFVCNQRHYPMGEAIAKVVNVCIFGTHIGGSKKLDDGFTITAANNQEMMQTCSIEDIWKGVKKEHDDMWKTEFKEI